MSSSVPPLMSSNAPLLMRHLTRRSAPPPTSRSAQAQGMEVMEREVLAMEANKLAPKFPNKVAPVSQFRSRYRNAPVCPRRTANRWQCRLQESPAPLCPSRTASRSPSRAATACPRRAAPACLSRHLQRWPRKFAAEVVGEVVVAVVDTMDEEEFQTYNKYSN